MRRGIVLGILLILGGAGGFLGWRWLSTVPLSDIAVRGFARADSSDIVRATGLQMGGPITEVSAEIVADRVRRHPWVAAASVSRHPTGTLVVSVREREPVALALDRSGRPAYFLDAGGFRMPVADGPPLDVPIVRGVRERYHPVSPVKNQEVLELVGLLPELDDEQDALISEVHETREGIDIYTAATPAGQSIRVRLGRLGYAEKLNRLEAFWMQSVLGRPETTYEWIDLRFSRQVVTKERA